MTRLRIWRRAIVAAALLAVVADLFAQPAGGLRNYAIFSQSARRANVVVFQESTGTKLEANRVVRIPMPDGVLDKVVLLSARKALGRIAAGHKAWSIAPLEEDLFASLQKPAVGTTIDISPDLLKALLDQGSTHLLLFTAHRDDAKFQFDNMQSGNGKLEGPGFYVDRYSPVRLQTATAFETANGYLGVYVYLRATLIGLPKGEVLATQADTATRPTRASADETSRHPWEAIDNAEKIAMLRRMLESEVERLTAAVVAR